MSNSAFTFGVKRQIINHITHVQADWFSSFQTILNQEVGLVIRQKEFSDERMQIFKAQNKLDCCSRIDALIVAPSVVEQI